MDMAPGDHDTGSAVPTRDTPFDELIEQLTRTTTLSSGEAIRVISEVVAFFHEPLETFVRRRHTELQREGLANAEIYGRVLDELRFVRLAAPDLSERQVRRLIYG
jgi:hypothetical protein